MRHLMTLALSFGIAASGAAQTQGEIIIRRPGVPDRIIRLDSGAVREELTKLEGQLHEMTITSHLRDKEVEGRVRELQNTMKRSVEGLHATTLALADGKIATQMMPMLRAYEVGARRPIIGISIDVEPRETDRIGAYIQAVTPGSPAERAGILSGDIVTRVAGKSVLEKTAKDDSGPGLRLISILSTLAAGKPVDVELRRGTKTLNLKVTPIEENLGGAIARATAPSIARMTPLPAERMTGELSIRGMPATPQGMNLFSYNGGNFTYGFMNGLFSNIELTALNEKLGNYFGATEGVLVVNVGAPRDMLMLNAAQGGAVGRGGAFGGGAGVATGSARAGRVMADSVMVRGRGTASTGRVIDTTFTIRRSIGVDTLSRRVDTFAVTRSDGVPMTGDMVHRKAPSIPVEPGDVIVSVDGRKVTSPSQLMRIVGSYERNDEFKLQIIRQKRAETLTIKVP